MVHQRERHGPILGRGISVEARCRSARLASVRGRFGPTRDLGRGHIAKVGREVACLGRMVKYRGCSWMLVEIQSTCSTLIKACSNSCSHLPQCSLCCYSNSKTADLNSLQLANHQVFLRQQLQVGSAVLLSMKETTSFGISLLFCVLSVGTAVLSMDVHPLFDQRQPVCRSSAKKETRHV